MSETLDRREFLLVAGAVSAAGMVGGEGGEGEDGGEGAEARGIQTQKSRVVVLRNDDLTVEPERLNRPTARDLLDQAATVLADETTPADAWVTWFSPRDRVAIKVNCLGLPTHHVIGEALAEAVVAAGVSPSNTIIWDRTDRELERAGYRLRNGGRNSRCLGTDSLGGRRGGYDDVVSSSGGIGSLFSRIVTERCDALISAPVLKDHNLAGLSCALKNFYGAIHNPNKYHDNGCDPFVADVCAHSHIRARLRLAVCDATRPQFHGGPPSRPAWRWPYGGLILSTDPVALDRVGLEIIELKRESEGMASLAAEDQPAHYLESAAARGLGTVELDEIEVVSIGRPWEEVA